MWMVRWLRIFTTVQHRREMRRWFLKKGRNAVWLTKSDVENNARISPWHQCVLKAWRNGEVRADLVTVCEKHLLF